jgi:hypothetical protein
MHPAPKGRVLAGIIPITGRKNVLGLPWEDCLQPLSYQCTALERSVYECAVMNCDSIWIICNDSTAPLIKRRIGDYVLNPNIYDDWHFKKIPGGSKEYIPVFYTPVLQKDRNRRDTLGWSILHGALTAFIVSKKISKWVAPTNYYVSFPYGIYDVRSLKGARADIRSGKSYYASYQGKTVRDNLYLPFSFTPEDWLEFRRGVNEKNTGGSKNLSIEERWSAKNFTLDKIFNNDRIDIDKKIEIEEYYTLDSWPDLKEYYKSDLIIKKMPKSMAKPFTL